MRTSQYFTYLIVIFMGSVPFIVKTASDSNPCLLLSKQDDKGKEIEQTLVGGKVCTNRPGFNPGY